MAGSSDRTATFLLLAAGAALFAIALAILAWRGVAASLVAYMLTPLFGLPYLAVVARRWDAWRSHLYFLVLLPLAHFLALVTAMFTALNVVAPELNPNMPVAGLVGGAVGSGISLLPFALVFRQPYRAGFTLAGMGLLTLVGGAGLWAGERFGGRIGSEYAMSEYAMIVLLFLPWQILLGGCLSRLLPVRTLPHPADACGTAAGAP